MKQEPGPKERTSTLKPDGRDECHSTHGISGEFILPDSFFTYKKKRIISTSFIGP
jgi:hypothetical protein